MANSLRLLKLPDKVRDQVATQKLSMGHARALLGLESPERIELTADRIVDPDAGARVRLDHHLVPVCHQLAHARDPPQRGQHIVLTLAAHAGDVEALGHGGGIAQPLCPRGSGRGL